MTSCRYPQQPRPAARPSTSPAPSSPNGSPPAAQIVGPVTSAFWHDGEFGTGEEWQLLLKTTRARYPELEAHLLKHHPWQNPEVAAVAIEAGSKGCLDWIAANTTPAQ
ncbi:divalent-cation tolerance protein CutA [Streptomyces sp. NPDC093568]|uniref:divalent-cation tolerance protein CutA n=1 Tax=Streptomyces sp. NPDC093568 TaxID=3366041 RepID=UPI00381BC7BE